MNDEFIGCKIPTGRGSVLTVIRKTSRKIGSQWFYELECSACSRDPVLYPIITSTKDRLKRTIPCGCSPSTKFSEYQWTVRLDRACKDRGYEFVGIRGEFSGNMSRAVIACQAHGRFEIRVSNFLEKRRPRGCPACAIRGFKSNMDACVYLLHSTDGSLCKVGISNNLESRVGDLRRATPFDFAYNSSVITSGRHARSMEKMCHDKFMSAGLSGFDGASEWLIRNEGIDELFK